MSEWNHPICDACWFGREREHPNRVIESDRRWAPCCQCEAEHVSGIFVRVDPTHMPCKGQHKED